MLAKNQHSMRIYVHQLNIGMYVCDLDRPWLGTPFLIQGFEITSYDDIKQISDICKYIYIDVKKSKLDQSLLARYTAENNKKLKKTLKPIVKKAHTVPVIKYNVGQAYRDKYTVQAELENAKIAYNNTRNAVNEILDNFKSGRDINISQAKKVINDCIESIFNNKESLLWFTLIKNRDLYTSEHCLNVTVLSIGFGRYLGLAEETLKTIGLCGLLHDIGKIEIPLEILNKEGGFTQEEFEIMKQHPVFGRDYLVEQANIITEVIDVAYGHHERVDGSGYPQGLAGGQISYYAKLIAIIDTYDAITSDRCYKKARTTLQAQKILYEGAGSQFDEKLAKSFIQWLGIYPPGSIVEMSNGEVGLILSVNPDWKSKPRVLLLIDDEKQTQSQRIVDLYKNAVDNQGNEYRIKTSLPNNAFDINLTELLQTGIIK